MNPSTWKYLPRNTKRTAFPTLGPLLIIAFVCLIAVALAHTAYGAVSEAIHQSITTPKGW